MAAVTAFIVPAFIVFIVGFGLYRRLDVFSLFVEGAREGIQTALGVLPALVALMTAVAMFRASGALDAVVALVAPAGRALGFPPEVVPLALLRPVSGSGALSLLDQLIGAHGPDSFIGRVAAVLQGSTETTFYTVAVYYGSVGVAKTRHTVPAALSADFCGFVMSVLAVRLLM